MLTYDVRQLVARLELDKQQADQGIEGMLPTTSTPRFLATAVTVLRVPKSTPVEFDYVSECYRLVTSVLMDCASP